MGASIIGGSPSLHEWISGRTGASSLSQPDAAGQPHQGGQGDGRCGRSPHADVEELALGREYARQGRHRRAVRAWRKGVAIGRRLAMPYDRAALELAIGASPSVSPESRRGHLASARATFEELGSTFDLGRCDELQARG